jgi:2-C-methyl-D-erythritol 4-phosphate cytidylyltransferase/2-C-methyl-D-erythritol 2,4-cyclodiphosphate synthase
MKKKKRKPPMKMTMMTRKNDSISVIIAAAGASERMGCGTKKEFLKTPTGITVLASAVEPFLRLPNLNFLVITLPSENYASFVEEAENALFASDDVRRILRGTHSFSLAFVKGGDTRQKSVLNALEFLANKTMSDGIVLVHDAARPYIEDAVIARVISAVCEHGAAAPCIPAVDTLKRVDSRRILAHPDRESLKAVQTPQGFLFAPFLDAHRKAAADGKLYTDDTEIWGRYVTPVAAVDGAVGNVKITYPRDIGGTRRDTKGHEGTQFRTGLGCDRHRLAEGRPLLIGGVEIPSDRGEDAHSDGDVLFHAVMDALLGAAALGDIGSFFPPDDAKWKDADSAELLRIIWKTISGNGWKLVNLDCVVLLEKPKLLPFREQIRFSIAKILQADVDSVFVKAKTGEKTGEIGRSEIIEAWVTCLLQRIEG